MLLVDECLIVPGTPPAGKCELVAPDNVFVEQKVTLRSDRNAYDRKLDYRQRIGT